MSVLDGFGLPAEWAQGIVVAILMEKGDIRYCSCYGAMKLLDHEMKVVKKVLEERFH